MALPRDDKKYCDNGCAPVIGVEYGGMDPYHYDGVSEWRCPVCGRRTGRFCGNVLRPGEAEPRYCEGGPHPTYKPS